MPKLFFGMLVTGFCSLGIHAVMLDTLNVPYPGIKIDAPVAQFISRGFLNALALIYLNSLAHTKLAGRSFYFRTGVIFLLSTTLTEALFRGPFMDGYCNDSFAYAVVEAVPKLLPHLLLSAMIVASARLTPKPWQKAVAALLSGAIAMLVMMPLFAHLFESTLKSLEYLVSDGASCPMPYGWKVDVPADLTFVEPVLAAMATASLVWDKLSARSIMRVVQFVLLIMLIRRQVLASLLYMLYSGQPALVGLSSMGQFTLEALLLGLLTALTWKWAQPSSTSPVAAAR